MVHCSSTAFDSEIMMWHNCVHMSIRFYMFILWLHQPNAWRFTHSIGSIPVFRHCYEKEFDGWSSFRIVIIECREDIHRSTSWPFACAADNILCTNKLEFVGESSYISKNREKSTTWCYRDWLVVRKLSTEISRVEDRISCVRQRIQTSMTHW